MQQPAPLVPVERALTRADTVDLSLATGSIGDLSYHEVIITEPVEEHYFDTAQQLVDRILSDAVVHRFEPGYKAQDHEVTFIDLQEERFDEIAGDADLARNVDQHSVWGEEEWDIQLYSIRLRGGGAEDVILWRDFESKHRMRQTVGTKMFFSGRMNAIEGDLLLLDNTIDALIYGNRLFLINEYRCRGMLGLARRMVEDVRQAVGRVTERVPISNVEEFVSACASQPSMQTKLSSVLERDYLDQVTIDDVEQVADAHDLDVEFVTENGRRMMVFDQGPARRWTILKVLDDDYLISEMTNRNYEAPSKRALED